MLLASRMPCASSRRVRVASALAVRARAGDASVPRRQGLMLKSQMVPQVRVCGCDRVAIVCAVYRHPSVCLKTINPYLLNGRRPLNRRKPLFDD